MRETTVKCLVVVARKKRFYTGQTVTENLFAPGEFDKLITSGHLNPVEGEYKDEPNGPSEDLSDDEIDAVKKAGELPAIKDQKLDLSDTGKKADEVSSVEAEENEKTVAQLKKDLTDKGIKFPPNAKKEELLKLWARGE